MEQPSSVIPYAQPQIIQVSSLDSQKYLSDVSWVRQYLLEPMFGGYAYEMEPEKTAILGSTSDRLVEVKKHYKNRSIMNDAGISYIDGAIKPLISHVSQNANAKGITIRNLWHGRILTMGMTLIKDSRTENRYEFDRKRIADIVGYLLSWKLLSLKAKDGNWIKDMRGSFTTTEVRNVNTQDSVKKQNALESVVNTIKTGVGADS